MDQQKLCTADFILAETMEFNADSVEWCPVPKFAQYLTCGTYQLNEDETPADNIQTRNGHITLYKFSNKYTGKLEKMDTFQSGVF
ncbi:diphthine methyltransferase [Caerostris darwini]|uniref:Diphthine methyltransferase n=1 Tax=Caerostris darwini TaxID=1538125 RepID=A0AAV4QYH7_9ARAC|nr:diphthine methyltransferase [Caerostris darwini]